MTKMEEENKLAFDLESLLRASRASEETLKKLTIKNHRNTIAQDIGKDWESLAAFIGVPSGDIDDIKEKYREPLDRRLAMMRKWHELWGEEATYLRLVRGLRQIGRRDLIEFIVQSYQEPATDKRCSVVPIYEKYQEINDHRSWSKEIFSKKSLLMILFLTSFMLNGVLIHHKPSVIITMIIKIPLTWSVIWQVMPPVILRE